MSRRKAAAILIAGILTVIYFTTPVAGWLARIWLGRVLPPDCKDFPEAVRPYRQCSYYVEESWFGKAQLEVQLWISRRSSHDPGDWPGELGLALQDGEVFLRKVMFSADNNGHAQVAVPLDSDWRVAQGTVGLSAYPLNRVRELQIRLFGEPKMLPVFSVKSIKPSDVQKVPALSIGKVACPSRAVTGALVEARFGLSRSYQNPFDPEAVDVELRVRRPGGEIFKIPAFFSQDYRDDGEKPVESLLVNSAPYWAARFTPQEAGTYRLQLFAKDGDGASAVSNEFTVSVSKSRSRFLPRIRLSRNPRYFEQADGAFFYPVGLNLGWPIDVSNQENWSFKPRSPKLGSRLMLEYLDRMKKARINFTRVWMTEWWGSIEGNETWPDLQGLGQYSLKTAWRLDQVLQRALQDGIYVDLVLQNHGAFSRERDPSWESNPYNQALGGPLKDPKEVMRNPAAMRLMRNRFRYIIARFGAYNSLFSWTLFNEMNTVNPDQRALLSWTEKMSKYFRSVDPGVHLLSTNLHFDPEDRKYADLWSQAHLDFAQTSAYLNGDGFLDALRKKVDILDAVPLARLIVEFSGDSLGGTENVLAHHLHDGLWAGWMLPLSGVPLSWWWNFILEKDLTRFFKQFRAFIEKEDLSRDDWKFGELEIEGGDRMIGLERHSRDRLFAWVTSQRTCNFVIPADTPFSRRRAAYDRVQRQLLPAGFHPLSPADAGRKFPAESIRIHLPTLKSGLYRVEIWDTWGKGILATSQMKFPGPGVLEARAITRDIAIKVGRVGPLAP